MATSPQSGPKGTAGKELQQALLPGEQVLGWAQGRQGSYLIATDQRAMLIKTGTSAGGSFGSRKVAVFPYAQLSSVDLHVGFWFLRYVQLAGPGAQARTRYDLNSIVQGENTCAFTRGQEKAIRAVVTLLHQRLQIAQTPQPPAQPPAQSSAAPVASGIPEQIAQLAQLRDQGILSPAEFEAKKADLLARM